MTYRHDSYEIVGKTVGVVGGGTIGKEVIKRLHAFDAELIYYDVYPMPAEEEDRLGCRRVTLDELLEQSDIITLHAPLLENTRGMIGRAQFEKMKRNAILVNTARGALVDADALIEALKEKKIWGAAFDVFEPGEPLFGVDLPNLIVTPHVGAATYDNYYRGYKLCIENSQRISRGEEPVFTI